MTQKSTVVGGLVGGVVLYTGWVELRDPHPIHPVHLGLLCGFALLAIILVLNDDQRFFAIMEHGIAWAKALTPWGK